MLTTLDTTRLIPRHQPGTASNPATQHDGPVFTIGEIMEILEDRPEIREALRQSLLEKTAKKQEKDSPNVPQQG